MEHMNEGCTCAGKRCSICEEIKCHGRFKARGGDAATSLVSFCIGCQKAYQRGYQACKKGFNKDNPKVPKTRRYSSAEYNAKWRKEHPEEWQAWQRQYRKSHPASSEEASVYNANYRARQLSIKGTLTVREWIDLKARYNNTCLCCGSIDAKLCIDHIVPLERGGTNYLGNIQPLCMSCNSRKHAKTIDFRPQNP